MVVFFVCDIFQVFTASPLQSLSLLLRINLPNVFFLLPEKTHTQLAVRITTTKAKA